jgi:hypothetical protein
MTTIVGDAGGLQVPAGAPRGFQEHSYLKSFGMPHPISRVWA